MSRHGSMNGGVPPAPSSPRRDRDPESDCCAKCRRGTKGFGLRPCGYNLDCPNNCHEPKTETKETDDVER